MESVHLWTVIFTALNSEVTSGYADIPQIRSTLCRDQAVNLSRFTVYLSGTVLVLSQDMDGFYRALINSNTIIYSTSFMYHLSTHAYGALLRFPLKHLTTYDTVSINYQPGMFPPLSIGDGPNPTCPSPFPFPAPGTLPTLLPATLATLAPS